MLEKTRTLMEIDTETQILKPGTIPFVSEMRNHILYVDKEVWEQMDTPDEITVTIEPGDKMNEEEDDG
jgi:hypothetical protein